MQHGEFLFTAEKIGRPRVDARESRVLSDLYGASTNEKRLTTNLTVVKRPFIRLLVEKTTGSMEWTEVLPTMALEMKKNNDVSK